MGQTLIKKHLCVSRCHVLWPGVLRLNGTRAISLLFLLQKNQFQSLINQALSSKLWKAGPSLFWAMRRHNESHPGWIKGHNLCRDVIFPSGCTAAFGQKQIHFGNFAASACAALPGQCPWKTWTYLKKHSCVAFTSSDIILVLKCDGLHCKWRDFFWYYCLSYMSPLQQTRCHISLIPSHTYPMLI